MRKLSLVVALLIAVSTTAVAHEGSIGLYTSQAATDCDAAFVPFVAQNVYLVYFRSDAGPNGITAAEFRISYPVGQLFFGTPVWSPAVSLFFGTLEEGQAVSFSGCTGVGQDLLYIGQVPVTLLVAVPFQLKVETSNSIVNPPFAPRVSMCDDPQRTIVGVLGGYFSAPDGTCNVGVEESSWGAIKGMYR